MKPRVIVVGGGIAGAAAALRSAQYHLETLWMLGDARTHKSSRARYVYNIDNIMGVHPGITQRNVAGVLRRDGHDDAAEWVEDAHVHISTADMVDNTKQRLSSEYPDYARTVEVAATGASKTRGVFTVHTADGEYSAPHLILATGVMDRQPSIKLTTAAGKIIDDIRWIYPYANHETLLYCLRCEGHLTRDTSTAVIGAGGAQIAFMLHERYGTTVSVLTNGEPLQASEDEKTLLAHYKIKVHDARIVGFDGDGKPKGKYLRAILLENGERIEVGFGFISMGLHRVYNDLALELGAAPHPSDVEAPTDQQHILVSDRGSETNIRNLFAVGDMSRRNGRAPSYKQIYTAQEYAVRAVDTIDRRIRWERRKAILEA